MTSYIQGLRIETPDGITPQAGESMQAFLARYLSQCQIGSAVSSDNNSGPSAPTADNIGQLQTDVKALTDRVKVLEDDQDDVTALDTRVDALEEVKIVSGVLSGLSGTSDTLTLPSEGNWIVVAACVNGALTDLYHNIFTNKVVFHWTGAIPTGAAIAYHAVKKV